MLVQAFLAVAIQFLDIGGGGLTFLSSAPLIPALVLNSMLTSPGEDISLWAYAIGQISPLVTGTTIFCAILDVFVPLVSVL